MINREFAARKGTFLKLVLFITVLMSFETIFADPQNIGAIASTIYSSFGQLARLITAGAYIAGLAFAVGAIMKFKQHKDNPTQVPIGTPIALVMIAASLLFLPSILGVAGQTIFSGGETATSTGMAWTGSTN
jgi:intracellular multiplication protein IcmD